jgi:50S ribosomal protein L16 3-hydroxylase
MKTSPGLLGLLGTTSSDSFFENHWPDSPLVTHQNNEAWMDFFERPYLASLAELLKTWTGSVQAHLPDKSDEVSAVDATTGDAQKLYDCGMSLLFNHVERQDPFLEAWLGTLQADLGLPAMTNKRCMIYATPDGRGTAPHFDQNINFVFQIRGTKRWRVARNESVINPLERHTMGMSVEPEMQAYASEPMPLTMPANTEEIVLRPGSLLFVPRGFWHQTQAEGESLALNFTFNQPTWIDILSIALKSRLSLSPAWRGLADGVSSSDQDRRAFATSVFAELLQDLKEDLPSWQADEILAATEG